MDEMATGSLTITGPITPHSFTFLSQGKEVLRINADGTITAGEGFTPTEAGIAAIEAMRQQLQLIVEAEREACAKIADGEASFSESCDLEAEYNAAARNIAAAIRARKDAP